MSEITQDELGLIRKEQEKYQDKIVTIRRRVNIGGDEMDFDTIAEEVNARISSGFGTFRQLADRFQAITPYTITLPWDQDVAPADQILDEQGTIFEVRFVKDRGSYQTAIQLLADRFH